MTFKTSLFFPGVIIAASLAGCISAGALCRAASCGSMEASACKASCASTASSYNMAPPKDAKYLKKYRKTRKVKQLLCVEYMGGSNAVIRYYQKDGEGCWQRTFSCKAYVGKKGMGKKKEGDKKTPTGIFTPNLALGINKDPGSRLPYTRVTSRHYWSGEKGTYNRLLLWKKKSRIRGEHLIDYKNTYNYVIDIGYNKSCIWKKGSAIFLHCFGKNRYTSGCVALAEKYMKKLVQTMDRNAKICIY